jgi:hypothetical protein
MTHFVNMLLLFKLTTYQMMNATALRPGGHTKTEQTGIEINCLNVRYGGSHFESPSPYELYTSTPFYSSPEANFFSPNTLRAKIVQRYSF